MTNTSLTYASLENLQDIYDVLDSGRAHEGKIMVGKIIETVIASVEEKHNNLYSMTGDVLDINTVLVNRKELRYIIESLETDENSIIKLKELVGIK